ncbi:MAG: RNA-binding protein [Lentisphaerae bacterium GWF2_45_14]|nr:MAG: RNA-binding protein [Lentisphaerae bacterium GWF2_45_14]
MNIYVGNMDYSLKEEDLSELFGAYGEVTSVRVITDAETRRPKGFAFVEMADDSAAKNAIEGINGKDVNGRALTVNEARPREPRTGGGGGFGGGGRGGDRRGGGGGGFGGGGRRDRF